MRDAPPPPIAQLAPILRALATLTDTAEFARHQAAFEAAHACLDQEPDPARRQAHVDALERLLPEGGPGRIFGLSFLVAVAPDARYLAALHDTLWRPEVTLEQKHFFYWQRIIRHSHIQGGPTLEPAALYASLLEACRQAVNIPAAWIPPRERDPDSIVVITNQLLGVGHAPTADCLDYCHLLQTTLKKKVLLVNTADMPWSLALPYYRPVRFNYLPEYSTIGRLRFKGEPIDFYQCRGPMPNVEELRALVGTVLMRKPSFVLSLGHSNVAPDVCADFLTVATMPFGTDLPRARGTLFILPRARTPEDADVMRRWAITDDQIIEAPYTFRLPERTATLTRAGLGLPADAYVIAVVGNRLDAEITDAVADDLSTLVSAVPQAFIAFLGTFGAFAEVTARHPRLAARSAFLGYHTDVLAVFEHCDAYFNPPRYGGGSSAAFALAMGVPVLTGSAGDVGNIAGPGFHVASLDAMTAWVRQAIADPEHRRLWADAARTRFVDISDREAMLARIVEQVAARADVRRSVEPPAP